MTVLHYLHSVYRWSIFLLTRDSIVFAYFGTWKKQIEDESMKIGLSGEDALLSLNFIVGVNQIAAMLW